MSQPHRWRRGIKDCRHRRFASLQTRGADLSAPRPLRARPVPHPSDGSVPDSPRCAATFNAANPAAPDPHTTAVFKARFLLRRRDDTFTADDHARLDKLFANYPRLKAGYQAHPRTPRPLPRRRRSRGPASPRPVLRPQLNRRTPRIPQHRRHHHRLIRRNTRLTPHRRASNGRIDRTNNLHPSPATNRPRLHQPQQLRSPTNPDNMTPNRQQQPQTPRLRAGPSALNSLLNRRRDTGGGPSVRINDMITS